MPEVEILIGGRSFQVACQEGEEHFLRSAASLLDNEAQALARAMGRVPETRMLLMAGLMLADKTAGLEEELRAAENRLTETAGAKPEPEKVEVRVEVPVEVPVEKQVEVRVEVPTVPDEVFATFSRIADRAEELAAQVEDSAS